MSPGTQVTRLAANLMQVTHFTVNHASLLGTSFEWQNDDNELPPVDPKNLGAWLRAVACVGLG